MRPVLAVAHRAGNSIARLHEAVALGVDVIECDVYQHRGRLEVRHLKTAGPLPFLWDKWEVVPASTPRLGLADVLEAERRGITVMLDLKNRQPAAARAVADLLDDGGHHHPVIVCGRYWPTVELVGALPYVLPVLSARTRPELTRLRRRLAGARGETATPEVFGVSIHAGLLSADVVAELHTAVERVMTWPVDDLRTLDRVTDLGVSGVIGHEPAVLAEVVRRNGPAA